MVFHFCSETKTGKDDAPIVVVLQALPKQKLCPIPIQ
jgi:hypothetical protein